MIQSGSVLPYPRERALNRLVIDFETFVFGDGTRAGGGIPGTDWLLAFTEFGVMPPIRERIF